MVPDTKTQKGKLPTLSVLQSGRVSEPARGPAPARVKPTYLRTARKPDGTIVTIAVKLGPQGPRREHPQVTSTKRHRSATTHPGKRARR